MSLEPFDMALPRSFGEACEILGEEGGKPIAGGSALITLSKEGVFQPENLVNLRRLTDDHAYIEESGDAIEIGALTTLRTIETDDYLQEAVPVMAECVSEIASMRVRNVATLGGHIAHADPSLDFPPVLAGLDATVVIHGPDGERETPFREFVEGFYETDLDDDELVKQVRIPIDRDRQGVYLKHRARSEADWPCVGVAAFIDGDGDGGTPEVFLTAVSDSPVCRVDGLEAVFEDGIDAEAIDRAGELAREQCDPIEDARGSVWYKREMAGEYTVRALRRLVGVTPEVPGTPGGEQ